MKIALLTLPFVNNYGGILQAYALKHFLELRGHSVCIIDRNSNFKISFIDILRLAKRKFLGNRIRNFAYFKKQYLLPMTSEIITNKEGIDVAFNHRSFIGGDLLRLQAGAEIKNMINIGIYVCGTKNFLKHISNDHSSIVSFERVKWYLENFYSVLTVPILLVGFEE